MSIQEQLDRLRAEVNDLVEQQRQVEERLAERLENHELAAGHLEQLVGLVFNVGRGLRAEFRNYIARSAARFIASEQGTLSALEALSAAQGQLEARTLRIESALNWREE